MINIVNQKTFTGYGIYIDRSSILGNPYTHITSRKTKAQFIVSSRKDSIEKYKLYFLEKINSNATFRQEIERLLTIYKNTGQLTLICWCKPLPCHGDIIKEYLESQITPRLF